MTGELPLAPGDRGEGVRDLHRRLLQLGYETDDPPGAYGDATTDAVQRFQRDRGLDEDGCCGAQTWAALVEAGYRLGDRLLYLRSPMLRGDDVGELQLRLGTLGFDVGRVDGIFGPDTERAVREFQRNCALTTDGVCGRDTVAELGRLRSSDPGTSVMGVRERQLLRDAPRQLDGRRIVIAEAGGLDALVSAVARELQELGAVVAVLHHPDPSEQARQANEFAAELFLGVGVLESPTCRAAFFAVPGFESAGGRRLAECVVASVTPVLALDHPPGEPTAAPGSERDPVEGKRLPVLRETRMPAVVCRFGPPPTVVTRVTDLAGALSQAVRDWVEHPVADLDGEG